MCCRIWEEPIISPGMLKRTLSHIWFRLYLPVFLFNDWIVYPYVDRFFYGPGQPLDLPPNDVEVVACCGMSSLLDVCIDGRGLF